MVDIIRNEARPTATIERRPLEIESTSYVQWSSILVGVFAALATSFVLLAFGSAVGLSAVSPWTSTGRTVTAVSIGSGFWMVLVHVWAFAVGGYLAGRMRHRHSGATAIEAGFRDGAHGATVWTVAVTIGAVVAAMAAVSATRAGVDAAATATRSLAADPLTVATDTLLRTNRPAADARPEDIRAEVARIVARSVTQGQLASADRTYLVQTLAARTGYPPNEMDKRVDEAIAAMKDATDRARKVAVIVGFITAATLLVGLAAAWWGATVGGRHRDEGTVWHGFSGRPIRT